MKIIDELIDSNDELTIDDKDHFKLLFSGFSKIFSKRPGTLVNHKINTGDAKPVVCKRRPMSPAERQIFQNAVDELIELVIFPQKNDDVTMGYRITFEFQDRDKTTFRWPWGNFRFKVVPFGFINSTTLALLTNGNKEAMEIALEEGLWIYVVVHVNDAICWSSSASDH
ncbi:unnamed protein product, partial [Allacma fusca]